MTLTCLSAAVVFLLDTNAILVDSVGKLSVEVRDPKDENIFAIALTGKADYLVTGDKDLLSLSDNPALGNLQITTVKIFLDLL